MERGSEESSLVQTWNAGWPQTVGEFEALVEVFQDRLVRYAFRRLGNHQDAEDAIQEVFVRAYRNPMPKGRVKQVGSYLYRMAANACTDFLRRRKHRLQEISIDTVEAKIVEIGASPSDEAVAAEELRRLNQLVDRLPRRQAEVVRLRVFDELSFAEIAEVVGRSVPTVKSRFRYGLERLRPWIEKGWEVSL